MRQSKLLSILLILAMGTASSLSAQNQVFTPRIPSPPAQVQQSVGASSIGIEYSRPSVVATNGDDRTDKIWGLMVPYDFNLRSSFGNKKPLPWRAGANENTIIRISHDARVEGQPIEAGNYGLFVTIQEDGGAMIIFSKDTTSWGSFFYEESRDALRINVRSAVIPLTERLVYNFIDVTKNSTTVALDWEKKRIPFTIEFDTDIIVIAEIRSSLSAMEDPGWGSYNTAARYCLSNEVNLEEGLTWAETSISIKTTFANQTTKAGILMKLGRHQESTNFIQKVLESPDASADNYYAYSQQLNRAEKYEAAINILQQLNERWPEHWLRWHGLARTYSAMKDYDRALENEKKALKKAPEANKPFVSRAIKMLEAGLDFNSLG